MENQEQIVALRKILDDYSIPDKAMVSKLPKRSKNQDGSWGNTVYLDYVGHAETTRLLIMIDPLWSWEPMAWDNGRPVIHNVGGTATMWGRLTVLGKTVLGVGTCNSSKSDLDKEILGDFLRNASMRLGLALSLWSKNDWAEQEQETKTEAKPVAKQQAKPAAEETKPPVAKPDAIKVTPFDAAPAGEVFKPKVQLGSAMFSSSESAADTLVPKKIADSILSRIAVLPEDQRIACKKEFVSCFGKPEELKLVDLDAAYTLIDKYREEDAF